MDRKPCRPLIHACEEAWPVIAYQEPINNLWAPACTDYSQQKHTTWAGRGRIIIAQSSSHQGRIYTPLGGDRVHDMAKI